MSFEIPQRTEKDELEVEFPGQLEQAILDCAENYNPDPDSKILKTGFDEREEIGQEIQNLFEQIKIAQEEIKNGSASKEKFQEMLQRLANEKVYEKLPEKARKEIAELGLLFVK